MGLSAEKGAGIKLVYLMFKILMLQVKNNRKAFIPSFKQVGRSLLLEGVHAAANTCLEKLCRSSACPEISPALFSSTFLQSRRRCPEIAFSPLTP